MWVRSHMLIKIIILQIAYLAISVVYLGPWHRNIICFVPKNTINFWSLLNIGDIYCFFVMFFYGCKSFLAKDSLIKGLTRIHASGAVRNELMNIKFNSIFYQIGSFFPCFGRYLIKLMINLFFVLCQLQIRLRFLHFWNTRAC